MSGRGSENNSIAQARSPLGIEGHRIEGPQKPNFVKNVKCETRGHRQHHHQHSEDEGKCYLRIFYARSNHLQFFMFDYMFESTTTYFEFLDNFEKLDHVFFVWLAA